jgi:hypothetical protein
MSTLAADKNRKFGVSEGAHSNHPVVASDIIYQGAAVGSNSGNARPLSGGDDFLGFAFAKADNSSGSAGDVSVELRTEGEVVLSVTGVDGVNDTGATVYASDDDTFTTASTGNSSIGKVLRWISGTTCVVFFQAVTKRSI